MIVKRISIGNQAIVRREIVFPSGKTIVLKVGQGFVTSDKEELDFLRTLKGLQIQDPSVQELKVFIDKLPEVPTVDKNISKKDAKKYLWHDEDEDYVLEVLKEKGYIKDSVGADPEEIRLAKLKLRFLKITDENIIEEINRRAKDGIASKVLKEMINPSKTKKTLSNDAKSGNIENSEISEEILFAKMKELGYIGWRKKSK